MLWHHTLVSARLCCAALLLLAGCDVFSPGGPSYVGVVVDAETGAPVEGIQLALKVSGGGFGSYTTVASTLTGSDGRFEVRDPQDRASRATLWVNRPGYNGGQPTPYNPLYRSGLVDYEFNDRHDIRVELRRA